LHSAQTQPTFGQWPKVHFHFARTETITILGHLTAEERSNKGCTPNSEPVQYIICHRLTLQASLAEPCQRDALQMTLTLITDE